MQRRLVLLEVGVRANVLLFAPLHHGARTQSGWSCDEAHDARALSGYGALEETQSDTDRHAGAALLPVLLGTGPGVSLEVVEDLLEGEGALADREQEATHGRLSHTRPGHRLPHTRSHGHHPEHVLHLGRGELAVSAEDVGLGTLGEAELVDMNRGAEGDEPHEAVLGQDVERLLKTVTEMTQLVLVHASVHDEEEDGGTHGEGLKLILQRGELGDQLGGKVSLGDVLGIVGREVVASCAETASPEF